jgi:hypothetical protein
VIWIIATIAVLLLLRELGWQRGARELLAEIHRLEDELAKHE